MRRLAKSSGGAKREANDKLLLGRYCEVVEVWSGNDYRKHIRFPVCLFVEYGDRVQDDGADYVLNISKGGVFIRTDSLIPIGSSLNIMLYIPPNGQQLGEFNGKVVKVSEGGSPSCPRGIHVEFTNYTAEAKESLSDFLEEKHHLLDERF
jgi:Tfp pilus assembly protein PilZ